MQKIKYNQYKNEGQCRYCGMYEDGSTEASGWFGVDADGDKICDACADGSKDQHTIRGVWMDTPASIMVRKRYAKQTPEQRSEAARKAVQARWKKRA